VTVPVAADGETVAVSVMAVPTTVVVVDGVSVVELAVVPVELLGSFQKLPQPVKYGAAVSAKRIRSFPLSAGTCFILRPFLFFRRLLQLRQH
jgi:hypothetical protein